MHHRAQAEAAEAAEAADAEANAAAAANAAANAAAAAAAAAAAERAAAATTTPERRPSLESNESSGTFWTTSGTSGGGVRIIPEPMERDDVRLEMLELAAESPPMARHSSLRSIRGELENASLVRPPGAETLRGVAPAIESQEEELARYINAHLGADAELKPWLPLPPRPGERLYEAIGGSLLLPKLALLADADAFDARALNRGPTATPEAASSHTQGRHGDHLDASARIQNHTLLLNAAASMGCCSDAQLTPEMLEDGMSHRSKVLRLALSLARHHRQPSTLAHFSLPQAREERAFRTWMLSLGLGLHLDSLFDDCRTGLPFLRVLDHLCGALAAERAAAAEAAHGSVPPPTPRVCWERVHLRPRSVYERIENCAHMLDVAAQMGLKVVSIGGKAIAEGSPKLTLAIAWQLMREDTTRFLRTLAMDERDILCWANYRVRTGASTAASGGAPSSSADCSEVLQVRRFADPALTSGVFMLQLLTAVGAECVNATAVLPGATPDECEANARYAISCAHKMGCRVFCAWEDLVQLRPKMVMCMLASVMVEDTRRGQWAVTDLQRLRAGRRFEEPGSTEPDADETLSAHEGDQMHQGHRTPPSPQSSHGATDTGSSSSSGIDSAGGVHSACGVQRAGHMQRDNSCPGSQMRRAAGWLEAQEQREEAQQLEEAPEPHEQERGAVARERLSRLWRSARGGVRRRSSMEARTTARCRSSGTIYAAPTHGALPDQHAASRHHGGNRADDSGAIRYEYDIV